MLSQYRLPLAATVPLFAPLLALPVPENHCPSLNLSPQRQRQMTLETIIAILLELAERQPVLFILEDLHWTDPGALELLNLVIEQIPTTSILTVLTCRPTFQPSWSHRSYLTRNHGQSPLPYPSETDCASHHRWENPPNRGASTDHCQDRWCPTFRRGDSKPFWNRVTSKRLMGSTNL